LKLHLRQRHQNTRETEIHTCQKTGMILQIS